MDPARHEEQISRMLESHDILPAQREVMKRFDREAEKNNGLAPATRKGQIFTIFNLAKTIKKPFRDMTRQDIETFIYGLKLASGSVDLYKSHVKKFFKWMDESDDYPDVVKWLKLANHKKRKLPQDILTPAEVKALVDAADNPRDRALVSVLYESGCRLGEIVGLRQKDVEVDQYGAVLMVDGKTGSRRIRLINSSPDLVLWLNNNPNKGSDKPVFTNLHATRKPLEEKGIQSLLKTLGQRAKLDKNIHPHLLRHSRFTHLARDFTESDLKVMAGWTGDSRMAGVYVHRSGGDVEKKQLEMAGLLNKEEMRKEDEVLKPRDCPRCKEINPATAKFCYKCGMALDLETAMKIEQKESGLLLEFMELMKREPRLFDIMKGISGTVETKEGKT